MSIPKSISLGLAFLGLATAIAAAVCWRKASKVTSSYIVVSPTDVPEAHILNNQVAFNESSRLNEIAAWWTGASAILNALAAVVGLFAPQAF